MEQIYRKKEKSKNIYLKAFGVATQNSQICPNQFTSIAKRAEMLHKSLLFCSQTNKWAKKQQCVSLATWLLHNLQDWWKTRGIDIQRQLTITLYQIAESYSRTHSCYRMPLLCTSTAAGLPLAKLWPCVWWPATHDNALYQRDLAQVCRSQVLKQPQYIRIEVDKAESGVCWLSLFYCSVSNNLIITGDR